MPRRSIDAPDGSGWEFLTTVAADTTLQPFKMQPGAHCAPAGPIFDYPAFDQLVKSTRTEVSDWAYTAGSGRCGRVRRTYWPFGKPARLYESRPHYSLFLLQSELDALLSEQPAKKRPFPGAKFPELVAALRKLDNLPNRAAQLQALCDVPEFRRFTITDAIFREATKEAGPRRARRKSRQKS